VTRPYELRPHAKEDLDEQFDYYEEESGVDLALRFLAAVNRGIGFLVEHPEAGVPRDFGNRRLTGIRAWPVPDFEDIRISYSLTEENAVRIVRILHGKRNLARILRKEAP
jgi:plasmid stabilization system protein ParE